MAVTKEQIFKAADQLAAHERAHTAEACAQEIERLGKLRDRAHQNADQMRAVLAEQQKANQTMIAQLEQARAKLVTVKAEAVLRIGNRGPRLPGRKPAICGHRTKPRICGLGS